RLSSRRIGKLESLPPQPGTALKSVPLIPAGRTVHVRPTPDRPGRLRGRGPCSRVGRPGPGRPRYRGGTEEATGGERETAPPAGGPVQERDRRPAQTARPADEDHQDVRGGSRRQGGGRGQGPQAG